MKTKLTKKDHDFLDISIQLSDFPQWYNKRDEIKGSTQAIIERETGRYICGYGSKNEILFFLHGYRLANNK